ncbi:phosphatase PAP2 family protein [Asanoa sp. WMMD1127]|uniref:phosphatase PAP2 family protein n=1 Tax=Asanoa sp. WMMD1127 TaxID=3016107 RepID=UPI002415E742|nr:phosphatase PAP2 family protein [Asanoa sp. WMMD1127]MDG4827349.1 phosphatase PAP2 family protein [Asanoa sp. WMMD1127]
MHRSLARPSAALPLVALAAFGALLGLVVADWAPMMRWDASVSASLRGFGAVRPELIDWLRTLTGLAATIPYVAVGVAATLHFWIRRDRTAAVFCALVTATVPILWSLFHWALHNPRPVDGFVSVSSSGFPSGHTSNAAAFALALVLLVWPRAGAAARLATCLAALAFALFIGWTRVALLAHWPTDVLGGYLLAAAVVPLAARAATSGRVGVQRQNARVDR